MAHGFNDNKTKFNIDNVGHAIKNVFNSVMTQRKNLKFIGNVQVSDNSSNDSTDIDIKGPKIYGSGDEISGVHGINFISANVVYNSSNDRADITTANNLDVSGSTLYLKAGNTTLDSVTLPSSGGGSSGAFFVEKETTTIGTGIVYSTGTGKRYYCDFDFHSTYPYSEYVIVPIDFNMYKSNGDSNSHLAGSEMISTWGVSSSNQYELFRLSMYDGNKDGIDRKPTKVTGIFVVIPR